MAILVDSGEQKNVGFAMADLLRTLRSLSNNCGDGVVEDLLTVDGVLIGFNSGCWLVIQNIVIVVLEIKL